MRTQHNALRVDLVAVCYSGEDMPTPHDSQVVPTIVIGWERQLSARISVKLLQNLNNTPDIGFQIGLGWVPHLRQ